MRFKKVNLVIGVIVILLVAAAVIIINDVKKNTANRIRDSINSTANKSGNEFTIYEHSEGWTICYPSTWDKIGENFIQEQSTGKTLEFSTKNITQTELEKYIQDEIIRKLKATETQNTIKDKLTVKKKDNVWVYSYSINSKMDGASYVLQNTIIFDGKKSYEFKASIPPVTQEEYNKIIDSFKIGENQAKEESKEKEVILYFPNNQYVKTGDEKLSRFLTERRSVDESNIIENTIKELLIGPKDITKMCNAFKDSTSLLNVVVKEKTAFVNFKSGSIQSGGSLSEMMIIDSIRRTLGQFSNVEKVQFLIDGKRVETLQGHADIRKPMDVIRE